MGQAAKAIPSRAVGELQVGSAPSLSLKILPPAARVAFQKSVPAVKVIWHDLPADNLSAALRDGSRKLAVTSKRSDEGALGINYEALRMLVLWRGRRIRTSLRPPFAVL